VTYSRPAIDTEEGLADIAHWIRKVSARLVVVDPLSAAVSAGPGWNARQALAKFRAFCYQTGVAGLLLHTLRAAANPNAEAAHLADACDVSILYTFQSTSDGRLITLRMAGRGGDCNAVRRLESAGPFQYRQSLRNALQDRRPVFGLDAQVLQTIAKSQVSVSAQDISNQIERNPNSIRNALRRLLIAGHVDIASHAERARRFKMQRPEMSEVNLQKNATKEKRK
jgi:hypothetical protein